VLLAKSKNIYYKRLSI